MDLFTSSNYRGVCTYFIQPIDGGLIKIGKAKGVENRLAGLQCGSPVLLNLLGYLLTDCESELHYCFEHLRQHGEWFSPDTELVEFLRAVLGRDVQGVSRPNAAKMTKPRRAIADTICRRVARSRESISELLKRFNACGSPEEFAAVASRCNFNVRHYISNIDEHRLAMARMNADRRCAYLSSPAQAFSAKGGG